MYTTRLWTVKTPDRLENPAMFPVKRNDVELPKCLDSLAILSARRIRSVLHRPDYVRGLPLGICSSIGISPSRTGFSKASNRKINRFPFST